MEVYILTHEYSDHSGFSICGMTESLQTAEAWFRASDETNVYPIDPKAEVLHYMEGIEGWTQRFWRLKKELQS